MSKHLQMLLKTLLKQVRGCYMPYFASHRLACALCFSSQVQVSTVCSLISQTMQEDNKAGAAQALMVWRYMAQMAT